MPERINKTYYIQEFTWHNVRRVRHIRGHRIITHIRRRSELWLIRSIVRHRHARMVSCWNMKLWLSGIHMSRLLLSLHRWNVASQSRSLSLSICGHFWLKLRKIDGTGFKLDCHLTEGQRSTGNQSERERGRDAYFDLSWRISM